MFSTLPGMDLDSKVSHLSQIKASFCYAEYKNACLFILLQDSDRASPFWMDPTSLFQPSKFCDSSCNPETSITGYRKRKRQRGPSVIRSQWRISGLPPKPSCLSAGPGLLFPSWHQRGSESQKLLCILFQHMFFYFSSL